MTVGTIYINIHMVELTYMASGHLRLKPQLQGGIVTTKNSHEAQNRVKGKCLEGYTCV